MKGSYAHNNEATYKQKDAKPHVNIKGRYFLISK